MAAMLEWCDSGLGGDVDVAVDDPADEAVDEGEVVLVVRGTRCLKTEASFVSAHPDEGSV